MTPLRFFLGLLVVAGIVWLIVGTPLVRDAFEDVAEWLNPTPEPRADDVVPVPFYLEATDTAPPSTAWGCLPPDGFITVSISGVVPIRYFNLDKADASVIGRALRWSDPELWVPLGEEVTVEWVVPDEGTGGSRTLTRTDPQIFVMEFTGDYC